MTFKVSVNFETYIENANKAQTKQELFDIYTKTVKKHGLDKVLLCLASNHKDVGESEGVNFMHNYPDDWMQHYFEKKYDKVDPVMLYSLHQYRGFTWDELPQKMKLLKKQETCLLLGKEAGLNNGVCAPLRGPNNAIAGLSLASSEKVDAFDGNVDLITAYSNHFYVAYRRLGEQAVNSNDNPFVENLALTPREQEILKWAAQAKSDGDIADIIGCSKHNVDFHKRKIFQKLGVNDKMLAVVKAMSYGLIDV